MPPETIVADAHARGLASAQFDPERCCIKSGALYVDNREAVAGLLPSEAGTLVAAGLPLDPDRFIKHIAATWFAASHPSHAVNGAAFADASGRA